jgi:uncharacterized protein YjbI with pentapeptide repeats
MRLTVYVRDDVVFYKGVTKDLKSPTYGTRTYAPGTTVRADRLDRNATVDCAAGINFCRTLAEALRWGQSGTVVKVRPIGGIVDTGGKLRAAAVEVIEVANLSGADLSGADLSRARLSGADLSKANLYKANLSRANLSGADLSRAHLSRAHLSGADLSGADLSGVNLSGADLSGADLSGARLYKADLYGASLYKGDMTIKQAKARGAVILGE